MLERGEREAAPPVSLAAEINAATRTHHTTLNRLITSRLPLALPPHATDPTLYTTGLVHFAHIYLTFESAWADLLRDNNTSPSTTANQAPQNPHLSYLLINPYSAPTTFTQTPTPPSPALLAYLSTLRPHGLLRSARLKRDLATLLRLRPSDLDVLLSTYPSPAVAEFAAHIRAEVEQKPWVLLAYAWCFYMAVFSGGRWIRQGLRGAGAGFWAQDGVELELEHSALSFWHFVGAFDGEDVKIAFKQGLEEGEHVLSVEQRVDVLEEAKRIFEKCEGLVAELDRVCAAQGLEKEVDGAEDLGEGEKEKELQLRDEKVAENEKSALLSPLPPAKPDTSPHTHLISAFLRRPEVTGTLVALCCLACVGVLKMQ